MSLVWFDRPGESSEGHDGIGCLTRTVGLAEMFLAVTLQRGSIAKRWREEEKD